jgi:glycosyltransferase involved in cell wall biosynthesis
MFDTLAIAPPPVARVTTRELLETAASRRRSAVAPGLALSLAVPAVDIVVPVYNEEVVLARSVARLRDFLALRFPFPTRITIADNASTDATPEIAAALASSFEDVRVLRLEEKGRGRALRAAWSASDAEVVAYMDVDLSTDLRCLLPLVAPLLSGHSELAIGSRLAPGARVVRGAKREIISRSYNLILSLSLRNGVSDAQCGFKAGQRTAIRSLLDEVQDENWFFDTELLYVAHRRGMRIHEVPVDWVDDPDSRVAIVATALEDLRGILRLRRARLAKGFARSRAVSEETALAVRPASHPSAR